MSILEAIIYGLIQGLTEFIPVSSSGHLTLLTEIFDFDGSFENDVLINIGTLLAALFYFRDRIIKIIKDLIVNKDTKMTLNIIASTIPAAFAGFLFADFFGDSDTRSITIVAIMLISVGVLMVLSDTIFKEKGRDDVKLPDAVTIGLAQVLALIPGTSRSGSTILAGRARGLSYERAVEYSFIIGIPIVLGAIAKVALTSAGADFISNNKGAFIVGNLAAFIAGLIAINAMVKFTKKVGLKYFGIYRIVLAIILLVITL